ncbi:LytTR family transcriptional regulator DNA-binding domain-containing protein [Sedimentibacter hydroxybenzoicus DSM 7310]|uniref:LytTR family transcriptional regulator DNA-binding domain-containing protein n=1 Tax=Sedimentibacter hydroxybenzoicus DSM 7310 TaxID=1123245 RepID=A0A974BJB7_SEDHY|nr:LytTR family transcriptional regulator DNA-binding domain-containing protein [Sedimentibacter hydroxybenzoicus]NYB74128.1 LytTR family transcriptional regulator DNA-binding domain-containing protein [Sedimentibacter hydroxybenzoicus DSM 7310]
MINIVLCDDSTEFCNRITKLLKERIEFDKKIYLFNKYDDRFKDYIENNAKQTIFILDIDLKNKDTDGYGIAKKIRKLRNYDDEIIFLTNYTNMSPSIIKHKIQPIDFIIKSDYCINDLLTAIKKGKEEIELREEETDTGVLIVYENKALYKLRYKHIIYINLLENSRSVLIKMHPTHIKNELYIVSSINSIMKKLDKRFFQISRTSIINKDYLDFADPYEKRVGLKYNHILEGSEERIRELLKWIK